MRARSILFALVLMGTFVGCGDDGGSDDDGGDDGGSAPSDDEVRKQHEDYCDFVCDCTGDCDCDYNDNEVDAQLDAGCAREVGAFFDCSADLECEGDRYDKRACDDQYDAIMECVGDE